jgi:hypothetical protein
LFPFVFRQLAVGKPFSTVELPSQTVVRDSGLFWKELEEKLLGFVLRLLRFKRNAFFEKVQERKHSSERSVRSERVIARLTACRQLGLDLPNANEGGYK